MKIVSDFAIACAAPLRAPGATRTVHATQNAGNRVGNAMGH